jgi:hypothetical protein
MSRLGALQFLEREYSWPATGGNKSSSKKIVRTSTSSQKISCLGRVGWNTQRFTPKRKIETICDTTKVGFKD